MYNTKLTRFVVQGLRGMPKGIHTVDLVPHNANFIQKKY